jgi:glycerol-1-phosphate dehydrogenase [NAD(P)+]
MSVAEPQSAADAARDLHRLREQLEAAEEASELRPLGLGGVLLGAGVLGGLASLVAGLRDGDGRGVALIADRRPMAGANGEVKESVAAALRAAGLTVTLVTVGDDDARPHVDPETLADATRESMGAAVLVSVGSGTVADIAKVVSARRGGLPLVIVQTAASVNGFADDQSVLLLDGVKRTVPSRWAERLLIDTDVISRAPVELNQAGLGDLLATYTAPADWLLARLVGQDDSYSPAAVALARAHVDAVLASAAGIPTGDPEAIAALSAALTLSGISMGVAGRTAPGSGMEHTVSHLLEMTEAGDAPAPLHGAKVGVLSVLGALLWARVRALASDGALANLHFPDAAELEPRVRGAFAALDPSGRMGGECWRDYSQKLQRWNGARESLATLAERWPAFDAELDALLGSPESLVNALREAEAPTRLSQLGIDADNARWAFANCHLMRDRFTVADLAFFMGAWERADVDALLAEAARLGAGL